MFDAPLTLRVNWPVVDTIHQLSNKFVTGVKIKTTDELKLNPLTTGAFFAKNAFLDILVVFRLDLGQISFNLVENAFATRQLALFVTRIAFFNFSAQACAEIKIFAPESGSHL